MTNNVSNQHSNPIQHQIYLSLPNEMYVALPPQRNEAPSLLTLNTLLLNQYGLTPEWFESQDGLDFLSGNHNYVETTPVAMAYSGHQFGHFSPLLGDGRALMLGQVQQSNGVFVDVQLKGSGQTPFSRRGDGRATLGAVIREYLISEAMAGLSIPTTRTIAIISTGESIMRDAQWLPGAIQVRTANSHIRVGSFQYAYEQLGEEGVKSLADFTIQHYFPDLIDLEYKYSAMLQEITRRQANLIAQWMLVGFIHGVMNTDNMSIVGETIDFGPCAFMDEFKSDKTFSSIDLEGRYAWNQQAFIGYWNLQRLAETLLPLFDSNTDRAVSIAEAQINTFIPQFQQAFQSGLKRKLGITSDDENEEKFIDGVLPMLDAEHIDFTLFFDALTRIAQGAPESELIAYFKDEEKGEHWIAQWRKYHDNALETHQAMRKANPTLIARNHQVEQSISDAMVKNDFTLFNRLRLALATPYQIDNNNRDLQAAPEPQECVLQTFCGT